RAGRPAAPTAPGTDPRPAATTARTAGPRAPAAPQPAPHARTAHPPPCPSRSHRTDQHLVLRADPRLVLRADPRLVLRPTRASSCGPADACGACDTSSARPSPGSTTTESHRGRYHGINVTSWSLGRAGE